MRNFVRACAALAVLLLAALPARAGWFGPPTLEPYKGADAGRIVLAIGATYDTTYLGYKLRIRPRDKSSTADLEYMRAGFFIAKTDYSSDIDTGVIKVFALAPGDYEIYAVELDWGNGAESDVFTSNQDFSIPFTVKAGETVYLGKYRVLQTRGANVFGQATLSGGIFYVSDQSAHDIAIAKQKDPAVGEPRIALPDFATLGVAYFRQDNGQTHAPY